MSPSEATGRLKLNVIYLPSQDTFPSQTKCRGVHGGLGLIPKAISPSYQALDAIHWNLVAISCFATTLCSISNSTGEMRLQHLESANEMFRTAPLLDRPLPSTFNPNHSTVGPAIMVPQAPVIRLSSKPHHPGAKMHRPLSTFLARSLRACFLMRWCPRHSISPCWRHGI